MNVSISALVEDLGTSVDGIKKAFALNALSMAIFVLLGGKLGDIWGLKRTFLIGVALTIAGSLTASMAPNLAVFMLGWCFIQGVGSALMMPNVQSLIRVNTEDEARAKAYGLIGGIGAMGTAVGPIVGGFMTAYLSWRWAFRMEAIILAAILVMSSAIPKDTAQEKRPLDWVGDVLQGVAMLLLVVGISLVASRPLFIGPVSLTPFGISPAILLMGLGFVFLVLFKNWEEHREEQGKVVLVRLEVFKNGPFTSSLLVRSVQTMMYVVFCLPCPYFYKLPLA